MSAHMPSECRRCTMCEGQEHHWDYFGDEDEAGDPVMSCKHCDATRPVGEEDDLDGEDGDDGTCPGCGACEGFTGVDCDETCDWAKADHNQPAGDRS